MKEFNMLQGVIIIGGYIILPLTSGMIVNYLQKMRLKNWIRKLKILVL